MLQDDNEWSYDFNCFSTNGPCITSYKCNIIGTLTVDGVVYQNLLIENYLGTTNYTCLLREDDGIVYYYNDSIAMEEVMLDFTLEVGDSFNFPSHCFLNPAGAYSGTLTVEEINTEFIAGENRKVLRLKEDGINLDEFWIEGIGSTFGVGPGYGDLDAYTLLSCFVKNGEITLFNDVSMCDNTELSLQEFDLVDVSLHPNPIKDISALELTTALDNTKLKIYDLSGKLIKEENIQGNQIELYRDDFKVGIYFYQIYESGKPVFSHRFLVK